MPRVVPPDRVYPYAGLRPGIRLSEPGVFHIAGPVITSGRYGDKGTGLCGAPIILVGQWWLEDYPMCPACGEKWQPVGGGVVQGQLL